MKKLKIGQIGIGHNHGEAKMLAVRKFPKLFEVVGYAEENEEWEKGDLSATNCTGKAFYGKKGYNSDEKHIFNW